ncbi:TPA: hypothetical protein DIC20_05420 [Candidatus Dependentiae bacterium]|nr:MAG: hypothetical protein US03_C0005G0031 [candidate division TM6 bacterium GW2011_GWF2_36_131]KKQ03130.1 MAG: hypothetical protein US13_C0005G0014 [candidate division TM6 bacterium GW2011_GWE2_36_25]KKQ19382.1 MAG: hypothetical protein US32_C0010G0031 [candidate division TM6 bacterium GW2011_GWA2_36_9]HBR71031.1 hypothetical protein [Candidatus Dependentiae bacterium]HCU01105.1 hypothetical protein [Candidatus Dependentiae bacterium]
MENTLKTFKIALLCGGPSLERGISLNSARSVMDHLEAEDIEIMPIYFDTQRDPYKISKKQLYSNTPSDFDFKLKQTATPLTKKSLVSFLKSTDITFPVIHGPFGEDGEIQSFLEKYKIPFIGSSSAACKKAFDKFTSNMFIKEHGFFTLPSAVLKIYNTDHAQIINGFFKEHNLTRAIVKPASGGSSIGVFSVATPEEALEKAQLLFSKRMDTRIVIEPFAQGTEFTVIVLQNRFGLPVALPPTEIKTDYTKNQIFDFRRKYLPTGQVFWHCPPRFDNKIIDTIQAQAQQLFALFEMHDFARFDGWVLPDGNIWFSDFNPISGMEQNSFLFQQASRIGMTHSNILNHIVTQASKRQNIVFEPKKKINNFLRKKINIIMGGDNSERQVSLMSGTNAWLKLRRSEHYQPHPYLLDKNGMIWQLPYHLCLNHTVEEIFYNCQNYQQAKARLLEFEERTRLHLGLQKTKDQEEFFEPKQLTLQEFINQSNFVFIGLHGGDGENGVLQKMLADKNILFNGPGEHISRLCMDKWETAKAINNLNIEGIHATSGKIAKTADFAQANDQEIREYWLSLKRELDAKTIIVKPRADGCSTGVVHLYDADDLKKYITHLIDRSPFVPKNTFKGQLDFIELPTDFPEDLIFEKFVETDILRVKAHKLKHTPRSGWIEVTVGIVENAGDITVFNPSITVAEGEVLSVEEKFQGGTGVNITPPPANIMVPRALQRVKKLIHELAVKIGIHGYSRIDAFAHIQTGDLFIIEINTLPALTPSTVLYQQALAQETPIFPRELLELLIINKDQRHTMSPRSFNEDGLDQA